jgi:hypothetical protein
MQASSKKVRVYLSNNPLDRFYVKHCDGCRLSRKDCEPGSSRELSCIMAQTVAELQAINRDMVKER